MSAPRRVVDQVLDVAVFGPLGFLLEARRLVPALASRGREHVELQLRTARGMGRFALQLGRLAVRPPSGTPTGETDTSGAGADVRAASGERAAPVATRASSASEGGVPVRIVDELDEGAHEALPIEGYDALAASQIVARLGGLDRDGLERVRRYEAAHRGRRTILHRAGQLLASR